MRWPTARAIGAGSAAPIAPAARAIKAGIRTLRRASRTTIRFILRLPSSRNRPYGEPPGAATTRIHHIVLENPAEVSEKRLPFGRTRTRGGTGAAHGRPSSALAKADIRG